MDKWVAYQAAGKSQCLLIVLVNRIKSCEWWHPSDRGVGSWLLVRGLKRWRYSVPKEVAGIICWEHGFLGYGVLVGNGPIHALAGPYDVASPVLA